MIKLFGFGKKLGLIDASPFVAKVHLFLKIANLEYKTISSHKNLGKAPKGKLPFIIDGDKTIGDSQAIMEYLDEQYAQNIDAHLSKADAARGYLLGKSLDENLYWCLVWSRWQHEATWQIVKNEFFKGLPFPLSAIVPKLLRKKVRKSLYAQGMGRHSEQEIIAIADKTFQALSVLLADKPYFFGSEISSFDVTAYAFISSFTHSNIENEINNRAKSHQNLLTYCDRIASKYFN